VISRLQQLRHLYPRQFWILAGVSLLAWTFHNMIMPFMLIYAGEKLNQPLTTLTVLFTIYAISGLVTTFFGGSIADFFGRKWVIVLSFLVAAGSWISLLFANSMGMFVVFMVLNGATTPLYRLATDAMMADLIPADQRMDAYSIMRMGNNLGVAIGPAVGGFIAATSYNISFIISGAGMALCTLLALFFFTETAPLVKNPTSAQPRTAKGFGQIVKDRDFLAIVGAFSLNRITSSTIWLMLGAYVKTYFGIGEDLYGFIPTTNALMVIFFQVLTTRVVKRHAPGWMMSVGAALYGVAMFSIALGHGFWMFWLGMVIATLGEMILLPTSTTMVASMAPEDMRGRYMSVYTLTNGVGQGVGPLLGGFLSDVLFPAATWWGGGLIGLAGAAAFVGQTIKRRKPMTRTPEGQLP
jgi:MFS family permease